MTVKTIASLLLGCFLIGQAHANTEQIGKAALGSAVSSAALAAGNLGVPLSAGLGAVLGYLYSEYDTEESLEEYLMNTGVHIVDDNRGTHLVLPTDQMFHSPNQATIDPRYYVILNRIVELIQMYPGIVIDISGHTDNTLNPQLRLVRSMDFAQRVSDYLLSRGVNGNQIIAVHGDADRLPMIKNDSLLGRRANRRVEISFVYRSQSQQYVKNQHIEHAIAGSHEHLSAHMPTVDNHSHPGVAGEVTLPVFGVENK